LARTIGKAHHGCRNEPLGGGEPERSCAVARQGGIGCGYYLVYRQPKAVCADGTCARQLPNRSVKAVLWAATVLVLAAAAFDYLAPVLLGA